MNKKLFLIPLAAFALASCSNDGPEVTQTPQLEADADGNVYLAFGLVNATGMTTRADEEESNYPNNNENFEVGIDSENKVNKVRFFFFDNTDAVAYVDYKNVPSKKIYWYDCNDPKIDASFTASNTVSSAIQAVVVLKNEDLSADNLPTKIVAVVNPSEDLGTTEVANLADLRKKIITESVSTTGNFLMSNSVYNKEGVTVDAVKIEDKNYCSTHEEALANPVEIYVERVAAKVKLSLGNLKPVEGKENIFDTQKEFGGKIYVKFLGWNVTNTVDGTCIIKNINSSWNSDIFPWYINSTLYHRSYWALNPTGLGYNYYPFTGTNDPNVADALKGFGQPNVTNYTYLRENAGDPSTGLDPVEGKRSQVIIAGQLVDEDGEGINLAEYALIKCVPEDLAGLMYPALKQAIYVKDGETLKTIDSGNINDYIEFKTPYDLYEEKSWDNPGRYNVYAQLKSGTYFAADGTPLDLGKTNESFITNVGPAKIWNTGYTYYYLDIEHINSASETLANGQVIGKYGVVRNHVYNITLDALIGLGTPVYDPSEKIIPEKPGDDYGAVAAQINILSWKIVPQSAELEW